MRETWVWSLGWEDPLEKGKVTHSSILAWRSPWTVQSMGSQRVRHDWATFTFPLNLLRFSRVVPGTISGLRFQAVWAFKPWPGCSDPARVRHLVSSLEPEPFLALSPGSADGSQSYTLPACRWAWGREFPVLLSLPLRGLPSTLWYYGTLFPVCRQKAGSLIFTDSDTSPTKCTPLESGDGRRRKGRESQDMIPVSWGHGVTDWRGRLWDITGFINCHGRITCKLDCQKKKKNGRFHTFPEKEKFSFLPFKPEPEGFSWRYSVFNLHLPQGLGLGWVQRNSGGKQW